MTSFANWVSFDINVGLVSREQRQAIKTKKGNFDENSCQQTCVFKLKIVFLRGKENVPPAFKQYKIQGNTSNLVQSHFGSPPLKELESGIAGLIFFQVSLHTPKNPFASLGRSYTEQKNHFAIGRNSERFSYHTDLSRFFLPITTQHLVLQH